MYHLYEKQTQPYENRKHIRDFEDLDDAYDYVDKKLADDKNFKYIIEETTGIFNSYGELVINTIEENWKRKPCVKYLASDELDKYETDRCRRLRKKSTKAEGESEIFDEEQIFEQGEENLTGGKNAAARVSFCLCWTRQNDTIDRQDSVENLTKCQVWNGAGESAPWWRKPYINLSEIYDSTLPRKSWLNVKFFERALAISCEIPTGARMREPGWILACVEQDKTTLLIGDVG